MSSKTSQNPTIKPSNILEEKPIVAQDLKKTDEKDNTCEEKALVNDSSSTSGTVLKHSSKLKDEADPVNLQVISFCVLDNSEDTEKSPK